MAKLTVATSTDFSGQVLLSITNIEGAIDGDTDFQIQLDGLFSLTAADFQL